MPGRSYSAGSQYRYGFNGKENDRDISDGTQGYGIRINDTRLGRFLSVDPLPPKYPWYTPYQFAGNMPIKFIDVDGGEPQSPKIYSDAPVTDPDRALIDTKGTIVFINKQGVDVYETGPGVRFAKGGIKTLVGGLEMINEMFDGMSVNTRNKMTPEQTAARFPITHNSITHTAMGMVTAPVQLIAQLSDDPTNPELWGEVSVMFDGFRRIGSSERLSIENRVFVSNCFVAGTKVLTKQGLKNIEDITMSDSVWSCDETTGKIALKSIEAVSKRGKTQLVQVGAGQEIVLSTSEHPFWINNT